MRHTFMAAAVLGWAAAAPAQTLEYRPIDTNKFVVQPTDAATGILSGTTRYVGRVVANTIQDNGVVRTINSLFGKEATASPIQPGLSPLPAAGGYPSTRYPSLSPVMPTYQTFGQTPGIR